MIIIYGIKNCDTMSKTFKWFNEHEIPYHFHNYKTDQLNDETLKMFFDSIDIHELVNNKGTTFRALSDDDKQDIYNQKKAIAIILRNPSILKRPIIQFKNKFIVGFKPLEWENF